jgi:drug/metabolite transporter (DMT)-like permease
MKHNKGFLFVFLFSLFWAIDTIISKYAFNQGMNPYVFSYQSLILSAIGLLIYSKKTKAKFTKKHVKYMIFLGILANGIGSLFSAYGLKLSNSTNYGFLIKTTLIFAIVFSTILLKEKITSKKIGFGLLLLFGAYLISTAGMNLIPNPGDIFIIIAAGFYSLVSILSKKMKLPTLKSRVS